LLFLVVGSVPSLPTLPHWIDRNDERAPPLGRHHSPNHDVHPLHPANVDGSQTQPRASRPMFLHSLLCAHRPHPSRSFSLLYTRLLGLLEGPRVFVWRSRSAQPARPARCAAPSANPASNLLGPSPRTILSCSSQVGQSPLPRLSVAAPRRGCRSRPAAALNATTSRLARDEATSSRYLTL
jgi:hypothetical protein